MDRSGWLSVVKGRVTVIMRTMPRVWDSSWTRTTMSINLRNLEALQSCIPAQYKPLLEELGQTPESLNLILSFAAGGPAPEDATKETLACWQAQSNVFILFVKSSSVGKRSRDEDSDSSSSKRQKLEADVDAPVFTLRSVSTTAPVRKKVDLTIHACSIRLANPTNNTSLAPPIPIKSITRAFLLPTRGKQKPHWSVVLMTVDTTNKGEENVQIVFGLDAQSTATMSTITHPSTEPESTPKGSPTLPLIRMFFSFLPRVVLLEPSSTVFSSACSKGVPGVGAYRAAKEGTLWFMPQGVLWGEPKACEFWACEDLMGKDDGLKIISATGRSCSVFLGRKLPSSEDDGEEEGDEGVETEFAMIEGKEQDPIKDWVRKHSRLFGVKATLPPLAAAAAAVEAVDDDHSDASDDSFEGDSSDDGGSATSSSGDEEEDSGEAQAEDSGAEDEDEGEDGGEGEDLKPENHPLMRPGAMPRMSRAAIDMAVGMVEDELMGGEDEDELMD